MIQIRSLEELQNWANRFVGSLQPRQLVLISGPLGAGKTTLVQAIARALGAEGATSPTYSIHQRYEGKTRPIDHVDLYRLKDTADLESTGFWDLFEASEGLVLVEWADRLDPSAWPRDWAICRIRMEVQGLNERKIFVS